MFFALKKILKYYNVIIVTLQFTFQISEFVWKVIIMISVEYLIVYTGDI